MTTISPVSRASLDRGAEARRLSSLSFWMLGLFAFAYLLTSFAGVYLVFPLLGLKEGDVFLFAHSAGGWAAATISWLLLLSGSVAGVVFAERARRLQVEARVWVGLLLNALALLFTLYLMFDELRMAYFPSFTFPFAG
ncbi:MAG TPA: hypothetical protein VFM07_00945 [Intrasporangium sp.]|nr:hypothetical protein [Intrasporangium sp.]